MLEAEAEHVFQVAHQMEVTEAEAMELLNLTLLALRTQAEAEA
jgi:hypothetical protein